MRVKTYAGRLRAELEVGVSVCWYDWLSVTLYLLFWYVRVQVSR